MNAAELNTWLLTAVGKEMDIGNLHGNFVMGSVPRGALNQSTSQYMPMLCRHEIKPNGAAGTILKFTGCLAGGKDAIFIGDFTNQSLHAEADVAEIVISGRFSGCTFAKAIGANGRTYVAHIFVNKHDVGNNPLAQADAFQAAVGAAPGSVLGFKTAGVVEPPSDRGYVIGTKAGHEWQWSWVTCNANRIVMTCRALTDADWVQLERAP